MKLSKVSHFALLKRKAHYLKIFLCIAIVFGSCKKNDITTFKGYVNDDKFFTTTLGTDPIMGRIINELKFQSTKNPNLIELITSKHGYPLWNKSRKIESGNWSISAKPQEILLFTYRLHLKVKTKYLHSFMLC